MLRTELLDLVNDGEMWAFVGAGACAGNLPSWNQLVDSVVGSMGETNRGFLLSDRQYRQSVEDHDYPKCFSRVEARVGREELENLVRTQLDHHVDPSIPIIDMLANWPFAGYITTNYDNSIENALAKRSQFDFVSVGNTDSEARKVSGGARNVVWHIHGALKMNRDKSHLVLTQEDYDQLYLEETQVAFQQLRALLAQHRVMFVGFGFHDGEVMRVLKRVGKMTNPARPLFAFASANAPSGQGPDRPELFKDYNIDIIPYDHVGESHHQLEELLDVYGAMILRRSLRFGQPKAPCPSYDPATTGLLIYNELRLRERKDASSAVNDTLLRGLVLARMRVGEPVSLPALTLELLRIPGGVPSSSASTGIALPESIERVLSTLTDDELVRVISASDGHPTELELTPAGRSLAQEQEARGHLLRSHFGESLRARAQTLGLNEVAAEQVGSTAEAFLLQSIDKRALGVALAMQSNGQRDMQDYQVVALLQALPEFMEQLPAKEEAIALVQLIRSVLSNPNEGEGKYIGLELQAKFGVHLLGLDPTTIQIRADDLSRTLFLLDSNTLIPLLARSSPGHQSAATLIEKLRSSGAIVATTSLLAEEIAEHARWASKKVDGPTRGLGVDALKAALGMGGQRSNAFLDGFVEEVATGRTGTDFGRYLADTCGARNGGRTCSVDGIVTRLGAYGIVCKPFPEWDGLAPELLEKRGEYEEKITQMRQQHHTFNHDRQVRAEAEALLLVVGARQHLVTLQTKEFLNAYFISPTRIIDEIRASTYSVTMQPGSTLQWLYTIQPFNDQELATLTNSLLWDLSQSGLAIVDRSKLQAAFGPLVRASKETLNAELIRHRTLVAEQYGVDADRAFSESDDLVTPVVLDGYYSQVSAKLEQDIVRRNQKVSLQKHPEATTTSPASHKLITLTPKQYQEYERLLRDAAHRSGKAKHLKRRLASKPGRHKNTDHR